MEHFVSCNKFIRHLRNRLRLTQGFLILRNQTLFINPNIYDSMIMPVETNYLTAKHFK